MERVNLGRADLIKGFVVDERYLVLSSTRPASFRWTGETMVLNLHRGGEIPHATMDFGKIIDRDRIRMDAHGVMQDVQALG